MMIRKDVVPEHNGKEESWRLDEKIVVLVGLERTLGRSTRSSSVTVCCAAGITLNSRHQAAKGYRTSGHDAVVSLQQGV
jgi:hypothetical protein